MSRMVLSRCWNGSYYCWHEKPRWFAFWRFDEDWMKLFGTILKP